MNEQPHPIRTLFIVNLVIAGIWTLFFPTYGTWDYVVGLAVGLVLLSLLEPAYGRRAGYLASFMLYTVRGIIISNLSLAWLILQPAPRLDPGMIAVPLTVTSNLEITILATVITLTPGTLSVDLGRNTAGERVLYVHNLVTGNPDQFRHEVKMGFERRLLQVTRGKTA